MVRKNASKNKVSSMLFFLCLIIEIGFIKQLLILLQDMEAHIAFTLSLLKSDRSKDK